MNVVVNSQRFVNKLHLFIFVFVYSMGLSFGGSDALDEQNVSDDTELSKESSISSGSNISNSRNKTKIVGTTLKSYLEALHYKRIKIDDKLSKSAFNEFIKKIDYGKQFLLKSQVDDLRKKYETKFDDSMQLGDIPVVNESLKLMSGQIKKIEKIRKNVFSKPFDFNKSEFLELDPDKRNFKNTMNEIEDHWAKVFKHATINRYLTLKEEQEDKEKEEKTGKNLKKEVKKQRELLKMDIKDPEALKKELQAEDESNKKNKKDKNQKVEKLSDTQLKEKAIEAIGKKYENLFVRLLKDTEEDYLENFYNAVAGVFDPHTTYLPPKKKEDFDIDISGSLEGIGAVLQEEGSYIKVVKVVPGGAAWKQKELEVDDIIMAVAQDEKTEPVDLVDMRVDEAVRYIRGNKGTEVRLTVKKVDGSRKTIKIIRDVVRIGESYAKSSVISQKKVKGHMGYIQLPKFYRDFENGLRNCTDDVKKEINRLKKQNISGLILDLRNNGGGALEDARLLTGLFIEKGPVVQIMDYSGKVNTLADDDSSLMYDGPLVVMVNRFSASASEIVAGALQDYGRAVVVGGELTHGKGTVQTVVGLNNAPLLGLLVPDLGALKFTIQKFYRVTGSSTQFKGISPDIVVPDIFGYVDQREKDLEFALPWDEILGLKYVKWKKPLHLNELRIKSMNRQKNDSRLKKITESVDYLTSKRKETKVPLKIADVIKMEDENKKMSEKLKIEIKNEDVLVSHFEESLKSSINIQKEDEDHWKEEFKERKDEWIKQLQEDAALEEALFILHDLMVLSK